MSQRLKTGLDTRNRFVPAVEALEDRALAAINISVSGNTVFVTAGTPPAGTVQNERVAIIDNGTSGAGNVIISLKSGVFRPNFAVGQVIVNLVNGNDQVSYTLNGPLTSSSRSIAVSLGRGDDRFTANLLGGTSVSGNLGITVFGQQGNDRLTGTAVGTFAGVSAFGWTTLGGQGDDLLEFQQSANTNENASESITQVGGNGTDRITTNYLGRLNGLFSTTDVGGGGEDRISVTIVVANNSTGQLVGSAVLGGGADDNLTFLIPNSGQAFVFNQVLDGGGGFNTCTRTTNVLAFRCQRDRFG